MTQGNHPPKLVLSVNVPTTFTLPFGDYKEHEGDYGTSWIYATEVAGVRHTLFADLKCHQAILDAGIAPGVELTVTKTQESYEKDGQPRKINTYLVENGTGTPTQAAPVAPVAQGAVMTAPEPAGEALETFKLQARHFKRCIAQAEKIYTDLGFVVDKSSPESINSAAATLFIQTCKSLDLRSLSPPQAAPAPTDAHNNTTPSQSLPLTPLPAPPPPPPPQVELPPQQNGGGGGGADYDDDLPFAPVF
jgi:hypothetical protein